MALHITDTMIVSDTRTKAFAQRVHGDLWTVFNHPDLAGTDQLDQVSAITAMTLAEAYAKNPPMNDPLWLAIARWREELGIATD